MSFHSRIGAQSRIPPKSHLEGVPGQVETQLSQKMFLEALAEVSLPGVALLILCWRLAESQAGCDLPARTPRVMQFLQASPVGFSDRP